MEIILWVIGIVLGILLLRFLFAFIIQLIGLGIWGAIISVVVCGVLAFLGVMEWGTCWNITKWAFYIGTVIGVIIFFFNPGETFSNTFNMFQDDIKSKPQKQDTSWKEHYSFYDDGHYTEVESASKFIVDDFIDPTTGERWEREPGTSNFRRKY